MLVVVFALGIVVGLMVRETQKNPANTKALLQRIPVVGKKIAEPIGTQFLEPVSDKEKFEKANNISDLIQ